MLSKDSVRYMFLALIIIGAIFYYGRIDYTIEPYNTIPDLQEYRKMAEASPSFSHNARQPFCYRILGPYIAGLLPFRIDVSFSVLAIGLLFILSYLFFAFLRYHHIGSAIALFTTLLLVLNKYIVGYMLWDCYQVDDLMSYIFIIVLLLTIVHRKWLWYGIVLLISILARETNFIMVLVAFIFILEKKLPRSDSIKQICFTIPAVMIFYLIRTVIIPSDSSAQYGFTQSLSGLTLYFGKIISPQTWYRIICNVYTPVSLIPFICFKDSYVFFRNNKYLLALILLFIASSFLANDVERLVSPGFPAFYLLFAAIFRKNFGDNIKLMIMVVLFAVLALPHHMYSRFPLHERTMTILLSTLSLCLTSFTIIIALVARKSKNISASIY